MVFPKKRKVHMNVDEKFFDNVFEKHRKKMQKKLGGINLSQHDFSKLIVDLKVKPLKKDNFIKKNKMGRKKVNGFFMF